MSTSDQNYDYKDPDFEASKESESSEVEFSECNESIVIMPIQDIVIDNSQKKKPMVILHNNKKYLIEMLYKFT